MGQVEARTTVEVERRHVFVLQRAQRDTRERFDERRNARVVARFEELVARRDEVLVRILQSRRTHRR
jgi:hypothetical protein